MIYLGPIQLRPASVKAPSRIAATTGVIAYASDQQKSERSAGIDVVGPPSGVERRKKNRRHKASDPMLETRAGRDRRKARAMPPINITI